LVFWLLKLLAWGTSWFVVLHLRPWSTFVVILVVFISLNVATRIFVCTTNRGGRLPFASLALASSSSSFSDHFLASFLTWFSSSFSPYFLF
jgi:hypothetical protein